MLRKNLKNKKAFTLVEMIVSLTVFTVIVTVGANVYVTAARGQRRANLEASIYNESRAIIDKVSREIRHNTIDYDEYYNQKVIAADFTTPGNDTHYGGNFGEYGKNFYDPGFKYVIPTEPAGQAVNSGFGQRSGLGAQCNNEASPPNAAVKAPPCPDGAKILKKSLDLNSGRNWWDSTLGNAFCDNKSVKAKCPATSADFKKLYSNTELYLINASANKKTILALEEGRLAILRLVGTDGNSDGIAETWSCDPSFNCAGLDTTTKLNHYREDLTDGIDTKFFVPITPSTVNITDINFIVAPLEDPRRAFNEINDETQVQPHVIIEMEVQPAKEVLINYPDKTPTIRVRTAISSRVNGAITSYDPSS